MPWRALLWIAAWWTLLLLAPVAAREIGGAAGYGLLIFTVAFGSWRVNRWLDRQYTRGHQP